MASQTATQNSETYRTAGGVNVTRSTREVEYEGAAKPLLEALDHQLGVLLSSSYEYPGRYSRWDIGFVNPPLLLTGRGLEFTAQAINERGAKLLHAIEAALRGLPGVRRIACENEKLVCEMKESEERFPEELRSKQPSLFSPLRAIVQLFSSSQDGMLGLYGAFGYDLAFQFEPIRKVLPRDAAQRDLVLFLPDEILIVDHYRRAASWFAYDFESKNISTKDLPRTGTEVPYVAAEKVAKRRDHEPGEYAASVSVAKEAFKRGDLFEVVPCQSYFEPCAVRPAALFSRIRERNPSPYGFLMNLGEREYLVGASPEMFVRVTGKRVETCPISGTVARGRDAMSDAEQILKLLNSKKDLSELTMCTDVDRNDKSRICEPDSVTVIGRRQIEMYSRVIHTVDHVEGQLRPEYDALDAFLSHAWAVTVTGAPKAWAMQFIEEHEKSQRCWYGGAVGVIGFDGNLNTGLVLRTVHIKDGVARVSAGATLLYDSVPEEEEAETEMKASAFLEAIRAGKDEAAPVKGKQSEKTGVGRQVLLIDHEDSFVHTLAGYFRRTGANVTTLRHGFDQEVLDELQPDLVVLSPGPGAPKDFAMDKTLEQILSRKIPLFGVCLGLQGIVEYYGGELGVLDYPMHGKSSVVRVTGGKIFEGMPKEFEVGRYHSLYGKRELWPMNLKVMAESQDGVVMALEHESLPIAAVQFHPESIMTLAEGHGFQIVSNVMKYLRK